MTDLMTLIKFHTPSNVTPIKPAPVSDRVRNLRHSQFPGEMVTIESVFVGMPYRGDETCYDLDGMEFTIKSIDGPDFDMADDSVPFYAVMCEVGIEEWEVLIPADATFTLLAPVA